MIENFWKLVSDMEKLEGSHKIINSILKWDIFIWWVVSYSNFFSNLIKFWTQSLYSHTTFCYPNNDWTCYVWWAENKDGLTIKKYEKWEDMLLFVKKLDLDYIYEHTNFEDYFFTLNMVFWEWTHVRFKKRFKLFKKYLSKLNFSDISIIDLLQMECDIEKDLEENDIIEGLRTELENIKLKISDYNFSLEKKLNNEIDNDFEYKKLFFSWWIIKFLLANYGKKYDLVSLFTMFLTKPFHFYNYFKTWTRKFFCSEFVSASFLYSGFYPFDLFWKYPDLVVPWDLMDPHLWIYEKKHPKVIRFYKDSSPVLIEKKWDFYEIEVFKQLKLLYSKYRLKVIFDVFLIILFLILLSALFLFISYIVVSILLRLF